MNKLTQNKHQNLYNSAFYVHYGKKNLKPLLTKYLKITNMSNSISKKTIISVLFRKKRKEKKETLLLY